MNLGVNDVTFFLYIAAGLTMFNFILLVRTQILAKELKQKATALYYGFATNVFFFSVDQIYHNATKKPLIGFVAKIPAEVLQSPGPIDLTLYLTDEEIEAYHKGLTLLAQNDKRVDDFTSNIITRRLQ